MGQAAVVMNDPIRSNPPGCAGHQIPGPVGSPIPGPPFPFSAPLMQNLTQKVLIGNKPAAVVGSWGLNQPPHTGLHPSDPHFAPPTQMGKVMKGSSSVLFEGKPAAYSNTNTTICFNAPGLLIGSATTVLIGA